MSKNQIISARILAEVVSGKTIDQAYDAVFGEGAYLKLAGEIYDQLRAKGQ
jgi:NifU-like protein involved in Fe-S cluster formation